MDTKDQSFLVQVLSDTSKSLYFSGQKKKKRGKMFIFKITGSLVLKSYSLALRASAFSGLYLEHFR